MDISVLPHKTGVYLFKDVKGRVIYIGKAKSLKKRVQSYFNKDHQDYKTSTLVQHIQDVECVLTRNEVEAFLLENRLIKEHKPKYNIQLKDGERYAYIKVTNEEYPRIITARELGKDKAQYYGPFSSGTNRVQLIKTINKAFTLRSCKTMPKKVCLYYHIGRCSGPCEGHISKEEYNKDVQKAELYLKGKGKQLIVQLEAEMKDASKALDFERAAQLRDAINALQHTQEQYVEMQRKYNQDIFAQATSKDHCVITVITVKKGSVSNKRDYRFNDVMDDPLPHFLYQYYEHNDIPAEIVVPAMDDVSIEGLTSFLKGKSGHQVVITVPQKGSKLKLVEMAKQNASYAVENQSQSTVRLQKAIMLPEIPRVIECFDISTIHGKFSVASMVQYRNGEPSKEDYRRYRMKTVNYEKGSNDVASMREVVRRRYMKLKLNNEPLPDLIVIDGGKPQLNAASQVLQSLEMKIPVISLAKKNEEVFVVGLKTPIVLDKKDIGLHLLQRIRDEAHRFAVTYHRLLRDKKSIDSIDSAINTKRH